MASLNRLCASFAVVGVVAIGAAGPAWAQSAGVGVVTTLEGSATLTRVALPQGVPLKLRDDVFVSDRITTGDRSFARILFGGKAIVTIRERSVLTITEGPGTSVVDVSVGGVAVAVVKERMKPGESVEIRTPNAVAGIRGTVVIAEVSQATSQLEPASAGFTTTITVLKGLIEFRQLDRLTRQPQGPAVALGALQSIRVTGFSAPRPAQNVPNDVKQRLLNDFRVPLREASATGGPLTKGQVLQAINAADALIGHSVSVEANGRASSPNASKAGNAAAPTDGGTATSGVATGVMNGTVTTPTGGTKAPSAFPRSPVSSPLPAVTPGSTSFLNTAPLQPVVSPVPQLPKGVLK